MVEFVKGRFDVLVATTIVESGLDIPNANTIFIDEADRYGLADLHQLRGRVGRYKHRAFCYLVLDERKSLTPNAARRLRAIEEFSELGAGFALAMRDLEIRGAGNLLGTQQSGHIAAVGYELYCQMLEGAVRKLKHLPAPETIEVDLELPGEAYLPRNYLPDMRLKIDLYRRMARVTTDEQIDELRSELEDRFGPVPEPARRMLDLARLRIDAAVWQIESIYLERPRLVIAYSDRRRIEQLARRHGRRFRVVDDRKAVVDLPDELYDPDAILQFVQSLLRDEPAASRIPPRAIAR
jgi:transcription-repair coupling factor (superfamily II helicase)